MAQMSPINIAMPRPSFTRSAKEQDPAGLPVEQTTRFELVVNMTTAKRLKIVFPQSILVRAEEFID